MRQTYVRTILAGALLAAACRATGYLDVGGFRGDCYEITGGDLTFDCTAMSFSTSGICFRRVNTSNPNCKPAARFRWNAGVDSDSDGDIDQPAGPQLDIPNPGDDFCTGAIHASFPGAQGQFVASYAVTVDNNGTEETIASDSIEQDIPG